jgi:spore maturation protein CgeB
VDAGGDGVNVIVVRPGPAFSVQDVADGWVSGLRELLGEQHVGDFNLNDRLDFYSLHPRIAAIENTNDRLAKTAELATQALTAAVYGFEPDVIVVVSAFFMPPRLVDLYRVRGVKVVYLATESPYEDEVQAARGEHYDLTIVNDPTNIDRYSRAVYLPHAYDPNRHYRRERIDPDWISEFCFVGTAYPSRIDFFEHVDFDGIDVALAGNWQDLEDDSPLNKYLAHDRRWCLSNEDTIDLYSATLASANVYRREAHAPHLSEGWSMSPREVELAAVGCFYLTESRGENRDVLPMVPTFCGPDDFGSKLRYYLARDSVREQVAAEAREAIADRTFVNNAKRLLERLG